MEFAKFKSNIKERRTPGWIKTFSAIGFIVIFLIFWLLCGDPNLLGLNWFSQPKSDATNELDINGWINLNIIWILLALIALTIIFFVIMKYGFKVANYDLLPFLVFADVFGVMAIVSGFIPYNDNNKTWIIVARLVVVLASSVILFWITIRISNSILLKFNDSSFVFEDIKKDYAEIEKIKKENEMFTNSKERKSKEKSFVEI